MRFAEALEQGLVPEFGKPDRVITTYTSKVLFFGDRVFKSYNHEPYFFADLKDFDSRKEFYQEDFFYNNTAAPEIYVHLWGVQERGGSFALVPPGMGEDFVIEMSRIDDTQTLTRLLQDSALTREQAAAFVDAQVDTVATLTRLRRDELHELFEGGLYPIMCGNIESMHTWLYGAQPHISKEESDHLIATMSRALEQEPYFKDPGRELAATMDNNSDNLLLVNGKPSFIDILPPMRVWRVVDEYMTIARYIADVEVMGSAGLGETARAVYAKYQRPLPPIARLMHEVRGAAIQWSYRYAIGQPELAVKFGLYAKAKVKELETLL